ALGPRGLGARLFVALRLAFRLGHWVCGLRARSERPSDRGTANQGDEITPPHGMTQPFVGEGRPASPCEDTADVIRVVGESPVEQLRLVASAGFRRAEK